MRLIKEIQDSEIPSDLSHIEIREAVRVVLLDEQGLVPLLFVSKYNYHKLPGGGVDAGEDKFEALERECLEEVGCKIELEGEIGKIVEYRAEWEFLQTSYCYSAKIVEKGEPDFTEKELSQGFQVVWMSLEQAIEVIASDKPTSYDGGFIQKRDLEFLRTF